MRVPIYESKVDKITPQSQAPQSPRAVPGAFGAVVGEAMQEVGHDVTRISAHLEKIAESKRTQQVYDAVNKYNMGLQDILYNERIKTIKGSDGNNYDIPDGIMKRSRTQAQDATVEFDNRVGELQRSYIDMLKDGRSQADFKRMADSDYVQTRSSVIRHEAVEGRAAAEDTFNGTLNRLYSKALVVTDPNEFSNEVSKIKSTIDEGVRTGIWTKDQADTKFLQMSTNLNKGRVEYGILNDPVRTSAELQKGETGMYPGLSLEDRTAFIKESQSRINQIKNQSEKEYVIAVNQRESDLIDLDLAGKLTTSIIKQEREKKAISAEFADKMIRRKENTPISDSKPKEFNDLAEMIVKTIDDPKKPDKKLNANIAAKSLNITNEDLNILQTFRKKVKDSDIRKIAAEKHPRTFLDKITVWSDEYKSTGTYYQVKADLFKDYMSRVNDGTSPDIASQEAIQNQVAKDFSAAKNTISKRNDKISSKIAELRKQGMDDASIRAALESSKTYGKDIDPKEYGL